MAERAATSPRTTRITVRVTAHQFGLLRRASEATGTSVSAFVLGRALVEAERVLADRRWFVATEEQYDEFVRLLDAPMELPKLAALFAEESPFRKTSPIES